MKSFNYVCLGCGIDILIEYDKDGQWHTSTKECPDCKTLVDNLRVANIIHDFLNPPETNPTQEYYTDKENNDKSTN